MEIKSPPAVLKNDEKVVLSFESIFVVAVILITFKRMLFLSFSRWSGWFAPNILMGALWREWSSLTLGCLPKNWHISNGNLKLFPSCQLAVFPRLEEASCPQVDHCRDNCDRRWVSCFFCFRSFVDEKFCDHWYHVLSFPFSSDCATIELSREQLLDLTEKVSFLQKWQRFLNDRENKDK